MRGTARRGLGIVAVGALALVGCSGDDGGAATTSTPPSVSTTAAPAATTTAAPATTTSTTAAATTTTTLPALRAAHVVAGDQHVCALAAEGTAWCWGYNLQGQLGDGTFEDRTVPTEVAGPAFTQLAAGRYFTCGLATDGIPWCWGDNSSGQLGDGTTGSGSASANRATPAAVLGGVALQSLVTGQAHACGLTAAGAAWCWGAYASGQLGSDVRPAQTAPVPAAAGLVLTALALGGDTHTCGLTADGAAWCWGNDSFGQLGDGVKTNVAQPTPRPVLGDHAFSALVLGRTHSCGLAHDGAAWCWGANQAGQLGDGTVEERLEPVRAGGQLLFASLTAGDRHTCGVTPVGTALCWGTNAAGQLGTGSSGDQQPTPVSVAGTTTWTQLTAGEEFSCGIATAGTAWCWGSNRTGWLGDGTTTPHSEPSPVAQP